MYFYRDKRDGMSREGSGRVAVYKLTGLIRSYTLECNYNSGNLVNTVPPRIRDGINKTMAPMFVPPKYTPAVFEAVKYITITFYTKSVIIEVMIYLAVLAGWSSIRSFDFRSYEQ